MATIDNLYARFQYTTSVTNQPIAILMHGWGGDADSFADATLARLANLGMFVCVPGMRGRNSADGAVDASGREAYDIYDLLAKIRTEHADHVSTTKAAIIGYSGGGGNALAAACKFPDAFSVIVSHFGMSDYGYDNPDGWWYNNPGDYTAGIEAAIGDTPANVPNAYRARNATEAIALNYTGGHLYLFQDDEDTAVPIVHSQNVGAAMLAAGLSNYTENYTDAEDDPRWTHGYPADVADLIDAEDIWTPTVLSQEAWTVPASGTVRVLGYIVTKRFEIWLGATTKGAAGGGLDEVASVVYDTAANSYTVTPLTGACDVYVEQADGKTGTAEGITEATEIVVS